jgi:hypothetical protein
MVGKWRSRFLATRLQGIYDEPRPGAPRKVSDDQVERVVIQTLESTPRGQTHWSTRGLAQASGLMNNDNELLAAALIGYEQQRSKIEGKIAELEHEIASLGRRNMRLSRDGTALTRKHTISAAARKRIAAAQRKRWAAFHKNQKATSAKQAAAGPKRQMSTAARKRIAEATKKRWAAFRLKKAQANSAPKVKTAGSQKARAVSSAEQLLSPSAAVQKEMVPSDLIPSLAHRRHARH